MTSPILYFCKIHGDCDASKVVKKGIQYNKQQYRCKACYKELKAKHYLKHKDRILERHAKYRAENPEKVKEIKRKSRIKHPPKRKGEKKPTSLQAKMSAFADEKKQLPPSIAELENITAIMQRFAARQLHERRMRKKCNQKKSTQST